MLHVSDIHPAPATKPQGALSPGLAALLDRTCEDFRNAEFIHEVGRIDGRGVSQPVADPNQLTLFDYNDAGDAVSWKGEYL